MIARRKYSGRWRERHFAAIHAHLRDKICKRRRRPSNGLLVDDAFREKYDGTGLSVLDGSSTRKCPEDLAREEGFK
eukprot:1184151-Amphidinium_carterae.1